MPRPIPLYIPGNVVDILQARRWTMRDLAKKCDVKYSTLLDVFKTVNHRSLWVFINFCNQVNVDVETMADALELDAADRRDTIKSYIYDSFSSIQEIHRDGTTTDGYIEQLFRGDTGGKIVHTYRPIARALGMTLNQLAFMLENSLKTRGAAS